MVTTADSLIAKVVRATKWPSAEDNRPVTNANLLEIADDCILGIAWPAIIALAPDYYVCALDHALVADYSRYRLPGRMFGPIKDVLILDADGNEESSHLITLDDLGHLDRLVTGNTYHFIEGDYLGIEPTPETGVTDSARIRYFRAPSTLALVATATTITAVDLETDEYAFTVADASVLDEDADYDVISAGNAHMVLAEDATLDDLSGSVATMEESLLGSGIQVGDYVAPAGTTPIVQVPDHAIPWLVALIASEALEHHDPQGSTRMAQRAAMLLGQMTKIASPRTLSEPQSAGDAAADQVWR